VVVTLAVLAVVVTVKTFNVDPQHELAVVAVVVTVKTFNVDPQHEPVQWIQHHVL
jgi:hypothetical protein